MKTLKILMVEDMFTMRLLIGGLLKSLLSDSPPEIIEAADGLKGWELAQREKPDLILTDVDMPGLDGVELCRRVKATPALAHVPVILITGKPGHREAGEAAGAAAFLPKPIRADDLEQAIERAIKPPKDVRPA